MSRATVAIHDNCAVGLHFVSGRYMNADPGRRTVWDVGVRPLACWGFGFESRRGHVCLSLVNSVCCQKEIHATGRSLVQRNPTDCGVSDCDRVNLTEKT